MAKRQRAKYKGWTCDKCGQTFATPGRHRASCTGEVQTPVERRKAQRAAARASGNGHAVTRGPVKIVKADQYAQLVDAFQASSAALAEGFRALIVERDLYQQERDASASVLETLRGALTPRKG